MRRVNEALHHIAGGEANVVNRVKFHFDDAEVGLRVGGLLEGGMHFAYTDIKTYCKERERFGYLTRKLCRGRMFRCSYLYGVSF